MSHEFELRDRKGELHRYRVELHPHKEGFALATTLLRIMGPGVARTLFAAFQNAGTAVSPTASEEDKARQEADFIKDTLRNLDVDAVVGSGLANLVASGGLEEVLPRLFTYTFRDGTLLRDDAALHCFAGNYGEAARAAKEVIAHNGFTDLLSSLLA